jgi:(1->4)-alpha-D-glucan 1-alpha-D-glucosylmutase
MSFVSASSAACKRLCGRRRSTTAWTNENSVYEAALASFIESVLDPERNGAFFEDFVLFQRCVAHLGLFNSLSATLLRLTAPGVPDIYQGNELQRFSLVDPDNRRPIDFLLHQSLLESLEEPKSSGGAQIDLVRELVENLSDGRAKLYLIHRALELRRSSPDLFAHGDYRPLPVEGAHAERLCAYARTHAGRSIVAVAPRLLVGLVPPATGEANPFADAGWASTFIEAPSPELRNELSGIVLNASPTRGRYLLCAAELLRSFPAGLLSAEMSNP